MNYLFWILQISLLVFWLSLNGAGIQKGIWQLSSHQESYSKMMESLRPYFIVFAIAAFGILISLGAIAILLIKKATINEYNN